MSTVPPRLPRVGIAIVNYKTPDLVVDCLASIALHVHPHCQLRAVVVDNASGDNSPERIGSAVASRDYQWAEVVAAPKNGGFAYGNNLAFAALREFDPDYIWLINPDTRVQAGALAALIELFAREPKAGAAGSRLEDEDGTPQIAAFNFPTPAGELVNTSKFGLLFKLLPRQVVAKPMAQAAERTDWVAGASLMLTRAAFEKVGPMDEGYFLYFEEVDYCRAIWAAGFEIWYVPESRVIHLVGAATGISDMRKQAPRRPAYWFESRQRYFQKNFGFAAALSADLAWLCAYNFARAKAALKGEPNLGPPSFARDFLRHSSLARGRAAIGRTPL